MSKYKSKYVNNVNNVNNINNVNNVNMVNNVNNVNSVNISNIGNTVFKIPKLFWDLRFFEVQELFWDSWDLRVLLKLWNVFELLNTAKIAPRASIVYHFWYFSSPITYWPPPVVCINEFSWCIADMSLEVRVVVVVSLYQIKTITSDILVTGMVLGGNMDHIPCYSYQNNSSNCITALRYQIICSHLVCDVFVGVLFLFQVFWVFESLLLQAFVFGKWKYFPFPPHTSQQMNLRERFIRAWIRTLPRGGF